MNLKKNSLKVKTILGIITIIIGIIVYFIGSYISGQVEEGKGDISRAQKQVDTARGVSKIIPHTEEIGKEITGKGQRKIDEGQRRVDKYETIATWLHVSGIVIVCLGAGIVIVSFITNRKKTS